MGIEILELQAEAMLLGPTGLEGDSQTRLCGDGDSGGSAWSWERDSTRLRTGSLGNGPSKSSVFRVVEGFR